MELIYHKSESTVKQPEIEVGPTTVYFRRNYVQEERELMYGEETTLVWVYEEATLSKDDALAYLAEQNLTQSAAISDTDAIAINHEYRLTLLELGVSE